MDVATFIAISVPALVVMVLWVLVALDARDPDVVARPRSPSERPSKFRSCKECFAVSIPDGDLCPECFVIHRPVFDPYELEAS